VNTKDIPRQHLCVGDGVSQWVAEKLNAQAGFHGATGIGWMVDGKITAGAVFNNYNRASVHMHLAIEGRMPPTFVAAIMDYPFRQLGCKRITGLIAERNWASRRFAEHLGARIEGVLQDALESGNLVVYGLLRNDACKWLTAPYSRRIGALNGLCQ